MFRSVLWKVPFWSMLRNPGFPKQGHDLVVTDHSPEPNPREDCVSQQHWEF